MTMQTDEEVLAAVLARVERDPHHPRHEQVKAKLTTESRLAVAVFVAAAEQIKSLHLYPWQEQPAILDDYQSIIDRGPDDANYKVALLLRRMLKRGISRYHPDPQVALDR
jgi:hypothetical protein